MNATTALARLTRMVAAATEPLLSSDDLSELLAMCRLADEDDNAPDAYDDWAAATAYATGAIVTPTTRNEHYYTCTVAGTSGAAEPTWPTTADETVVDGGVTWQESGAALWVRTWDLNRGAAEGWRWKAAALAGKFDFSADGASYNRSQAVKQCQDMAAQYARKIVSSAIVRSQLYDPDAEEEDEE